jgi:beta-lactamase superfamily II metal-dependent hydrolase
MGVFYAQVEQANAVQDYPPFKRCLRLVAVDEAAFHGLAFNSALGCSTYFVDVAWGQVFFERDFGGKIRGQGSDGPWRWMSDSLLDDWPDSLWIRLGYTPAAKPTGAYYYEIFANEDQTNIVIESVQLLAGPAVTPPPLSTIGPTVASSQTFKLWAFHVGQGMCALLEGHQDGVLLDVGAGTPINRQAYRNWMKAPTSPAFVNDLRTHTQGLDLQAVLSHPDSDHWRLLDWDSQLFAATKHIYMPAHTAALALKSNRTVGIVSSLAGTTTVTIGPTGPRLLTAHRSSPSVSDRNGECLVVETHTGQQSQERCLFPGDYVYDRMAKDGVAAIAGLASATLDAVMVPHHGDAASAVVLVVPRIAGTTDAFFSAGTHAGYGHPTQSSISAHTAAGFRNVNRHTCTDILAHRLP